MTDNITFFRSVKGSVFSLISLLFSVMHCSFANYNGDHLIINISLIFAIIATLKQESRQLSLAAIAFSLTLLVVSRIPLSFP